MHRKFMFGTDAIVDEDDGSIVKSGAMRDETVVTVQETHNAPDGESDATAKTAREVQWPTGRKRAKKEENKKNIIMKKLKLAWHSLVEIKTRNEALNCHNYILCFTNGPRSVESDSAKEYFPLLQKEALQKLLERMRKLPGTDQTRSDEEEPADISYFLLLLFLLHRCFMTQRRVWRYFSSSCR